MVKILLLWVGMKVLAMSTVGLVRFTKTMTSPAWVLFVYSGLFGIGAVIVLKVLLNI